MKTFQVTLAAIALVAAGSSAFADTGASGIGNHFNPSDLTVATASYTQPTATVDTAKSGLLFQARTDAEAHASH